MAVLVEIRKMILMIRAGLLIASLFTLAGCSSVIPEQNVDPAKNNQATFRKDMKECREDYPEQGSGVHIRQWQGCMNLKGWK